MNIGEQSPQPSPFPRAHRLLDAAAFQRVFEDGHRVKGREMTLVMAANDLQKSRLGLAVSKKALPKAVQRNRVKRLVRESFRLHTDLPSADFVFMARPGLRRMSNEEIRNLLFKLWQKAARRAQQSN